jgi:Uma2 family endonuclease
MIATLLETPLREENVLANGLADSLYEIINGEYVEKPSMSTIGSKVVTDVTIFLGTYVNQNKLGEVCTETLFRLSPNAKRSWRPDVAFIANERWAPDRSFPEGESWELVPDLTIEVNSPTNDADDILDRIEAYFAGGVRQVWIIYPRHFKVYVYDSPVSVRILQPPDELDGGTIIPGFRLSVARFFARVPKRQPV